MRENAAQGSLFASAEDQDVCCVTAAYIANSRSTLESPPRPTALDSAQGESHSQPDAPPSGKDCP